MRSGRGYAVGASLPIGSEPWFRAEGRAGVVGSARGAWTARHVLARLVWFPLAAASIRACGSPAHGSPTFFTVGIRLISLARAGGAWARRRFRRG